MVSSLSSYSVSAINVPAVTYSDPVLQYRQDRVGYEQGFSLNKVYALSGIVDTSINNYTSQYLTKKVVFDQIFNFQGKIVPLKTITTRLVFNTLKKYGSSKQRILYIYKNTDSDSTLYTTARGLLSSQIGFDNNVYFELEILNETFLRVKHNNGKFDYFLNACPNGSMPFISYSSDILSLSSERNDFFRYYIDNKGYLQLIKKTPSGPKIVVLNGDRLAMIPLSSNSRASDTVIKIDYNFLNTYPIVNNSWVSYNTSKLNDLEILREKSSFDNSSQFLLHTNYNEIDSVINLNYLPLNNIKSEKNYIKRGSTMLEGAPIYPDPGFRDYTSLQTGNNQELGNDNISLNYVWYDKDIKIAPGEDTYFTTPSSLYPFDRININDTQFKLNGSFGGSSPYLSDKIFSLRGSPFDIGNGRYLCTWLSGGSNAQPGIWVDRYYYPDIILKNEALSGIKVYEPSFYDSIDRIDITDKVAISQKTFFDKKSDLVLLPNSKYFYSRIGDDDINSVISSSSPLASGFTDYYDTNNIRKIFNTNEISYDGTKYSKYEVARDINKTNSLTISFDAYIDPSKKYGYQILGNLTNSGLGIINDEKITPFIFSYSTNLLKIFNTSGVLINEVTFDKNIIDVITMGGIGDFFVICDSGYVYKLNTLGIKTKLEILPQLINYKNYHQDERQITFLTNGYNCYTVDKNNLSVSSVTAIPLSANILNYGITSLNSPRSIVRYDGVLYALQGQKVKYTDKTNVYYSVNDETILKQNLRTGNLVQFVASNTRSIRDFTVTEEEEIAIVHDNTKVTIFDKSRNLISSTDYSNFIGIDSSIFSIDVISEYTDSGKNNSLVFSYINQNKIYIYFTSTGVITDTGLVNSKENIGSFRLYSNRLKSCLTNYNYFKREVTTNGLNFKLTLTNYLSSEDIYSSNIKFDLNNLDRGYHTFTYKFDSLKGSINLYVNGILQGTDKVPPAKYTIQNIFKDDLYIGTTGFYNGIDLATYLNQPGYYYIRNIKIKNFFIYNRSVTDNEVTALNIFGEPINDLILSIPAGQRNNIEEIERYFKFSPVSSSSKKINIYVKNTGIQDPDMKNNIKNLILKDASSILPLGVTVNDIIFVDFK